uniref:Uncharacterized protein n=1 Tax=Anguilla anguilla TaxID=7936 RepID=A0A0E9WQT6_ANGAN
MFKSINECSKLVISPMTHAGLTYSSPPSQQSKIVLQPQIVIGTTVV